MHCLLRLKRYPDAIAEAERVVRQFPYGSGKDPVEHAVKQYRNWAYDQHRSGSTDEAIAAYTELMTYLPDDTDLYYWRAVAQDGLGRSAAALDDYRRVMAMDPLHLKAHKQADRLLARQSRWDEVLALWDAYIERRPDDAEAYFERGGASFNRSDFSAASADAQRACDLGKQEACVWVTRLKSRPAAR